MPAAAFAIMLTASFAHVTPIRSGVVSGQEWSRCLPGRLEAVGEALDARAGTAGRLDEEEATPVAGDVPGHLPGAVSSAGTWTEHPTRRSAGTRPLNISFVFPFWTGTTTLSPCSSGLHRPYGEASLRPGRRRAAHRPNPSTSPSSSTWWTCVDLQSRAHPLVGSLDLDPRGPGPFSTLRNHPSITVARCETSVS